MSVFEFTFEKLFADFAEELPELDAPDEEPEYPLLFELPDESAELLDELDDPDELLEEDEEPEYPELLELVEPEE